MKRSVSRGLAHYFRLIFILHRLPHFRQLGRMISHILMTVYVDWRRYSHTTDFVEEQCLLKDTPFCHVTPYNLVEIKQGLG